MATYSDYVAAIVGKTFTTNFFYTVSTAATESYSGNVVTGGTVSGYGASTVQGTVAAVDANAGIISIGGTSYQIHGAAAGTRDALVLGPVSAGNATPFPAPTVVLSNTGAQPTGPITYSGSRPYDTPGAACFAAGTLIATIRGDVPVESLALGDHVLTSDGEALPVRWLGHRRVVCENNPWALHIAPVRIEAGAIAPDRPSRDLVVSPGHRLALGGWLVEAENLVNGSTIRRETEASVTYWHVELDRHAVIFAENVPAESFIDVGNKDGFDNGDGLVLDADDIARALASYCLPMANDRDTIARLRAPLDRRAELIGWALQLA